MERQQNIRQASVRKVALNLTLSGLEILQNQDGGDIVMVGGASPHFCHKCGNETSINIACC